MVILFIGPSASGKDTQASLLQNKYGYDLIATGELLRDISDGKNKIQEMIRKYMQEGFSNDNLVYGLLEVYLKYNTSQHIIFSGGVRRRSQISLMDQALAKINKKMDLVVNFVLSDDEAIRRMGGRLYCPVCGSNYHLIYNPPIVENTCNICGANLKVREDDTPEAIKLRLKEFHSNNDDIVAEYKKRGILIEIDASKSIKDIHTEIIKILFSNNENSNKK